MHVDHATARDALVESLDALVVALVHLNLGLQLPRAIHVGSVFDADDDNSMFSVIKPIEDAVRAAPSRPVALKLSLQGLADDSRDLDERTEHELHDGRRNTLG